MAISLPRSLSVSLSLSLPLSLSLHPSICLLLSLSSALCLDLLPWLGGWLQEYFFNNELSISDLSVHKMNCHATLKSEVVVTISDGVNERCFVLHTPPNKQRMGVVVFSHMSGGSASVCGSKVRAWAGGCDGVSE
jgi:hypothetical protein